MSESQQSQPPLILFLMNWKRTGDLMSIHEAIDEMKRQEAIIQSLNPHAVELWRQGQEILDNYPARLKHLTEELARWFLTNYLHEIQTPEELEKAYYSHSFSDPLFEKWKQSRMRVSYQTAEDVAFQWRLQELINANSDVISGSNVFYPCPSCKQSACVNVAYSKNLFSIRYTFCSNCGHILTDNRV